MKSKAIATVLPPETKLRACMEVRKGDRWMFIEVDIDPDRAPPKPLYIGERKIHHVMIVPPSWPWGKFPD